MHTVFNSRANIYAFPSFFLFFSHPSPYLRLKKNFFTGYLSFSLFLSNICVALNGLFADMRMSSSMYEVFNWNSSPDPPLTPAKHKRASLSLPPTTDIFAVADKSDSDTRRPMIQRAASGESWCFRSLNMIGKKSVLVCFKNGYCLSLCLSLC